MPKLSLNVDQQLTLLSVLTRIDGHDVITPGVEDGPKTVRVLYNYGAERRSLVKNLNALKASIAHWEETRLGIIKEHFGEASPDEVSETAIKCKIDLVVASQVKEDVELLPFSHKAIYLDNQLPAPELTVLDEHKLVLDPSDI